MNPLTILCLFFNTVTSFNFPGVNTIIRNDFLIFSNIIVDKEIPCHHQSSRVKTFESSRLKLAKVNIHDDDLFKLYDLIAFRFVFYTKDDLFKFFHSVRQEKIITYTMNYIQHPKDNGYKAYHFRYRNSNRECPIQQIECQLYLIEDYYESIYGACSKYKDYIYENKIITSV